MAIDSIAINKLSVSSKISNITINLDHFSLKSVKGMRTRNFNILNLKIPVIIALALKKKIARVIITYQFIVKRNTYFQRQLIFHSVYSE